MCSYAISIARGYSLGEDAIDSAMDRVVDWLIPNLDKPCEVRNLLTLAQKIVDNSLKNSSRLRKTESVDLGTVKKQMLQHRIDPDFDYPDDADGEDDISYSDAGWQVFEIIRQGEFLRVRPDQIDNPGERRVARLYSEGFTQAEISQKLEVSSAYISKVLKKYKIPKKRKETPDYQKPGLARVYDANTGAFKRFEKPSGKIIITGQEKNQLPIKV